MPFESPATGGAGWSARLALGFARRGGKTSLVHRRHDGPLVVQKALHPEGEGVCHAILVHPPSGIAGGDTLDVRVDVGAQAHALVTTPGAGKWYRTRGPQAQQRVRLTVEAGGVLEWLPQETIVYNGAHARSTLEVDLAGDAAVVASDVVCFGRTASGERFRSGAFAMSTRVARDGKALWIERGRVEGGSALLDSPVGLAGEPVVGTLLAVSPRVDDALLDACRAVRPLAGRGAVTRLPGLLVARWLGPACEPCRHWFIALWARLRPAIAGRDAVPPRIWST